MLTCLQIVLMDELIVTHSSTHDKKKMLDKIAIRLGVKLIVEEI
jgi:hypothetical protein